MEKDRYEFKVEYRKKEGGRVCTRFSKAYARSMQEAEDRIRSTTKHLVSITPVVGHVDALDEAEMILKEQDECFICGKPRISFSKFCKEHYAKINGTENILQVNRSNYF